MATNRTKDLKAGECGYFSFVPILREVCGSRTSGQNCSDRASVHTKINVCATSLETEEVAAGFSMLPFLSQLKGKTIFVHTDCKTHLPLMQGTLQTEYNADEVGMSDHDYLVYSAFWERKVKQASKGSHPLPDPDCTWSRGSGQALQCLENLAWRTTKGVNSSAPVFRAANDFAVCPDFVSKLPSADK